MTLRALQQNPSMARWWGALVAVAIALLAPLFFSEVPPLLDYPNHLARMDILAHGQQDAALSRMYLVKWHIVPNIGIDATLPVLAKILPIEVVGRISIALALLLPFFGTVYLHHVLFRRYSYWPLAAALIAYNRLLFTGFLNFLIGIGLALLATAIWQANREKILAARLVPSIIAAVVIFFCHLIAVAFYGFLLLCVELQHMWKRRSFDAPAIFVLILPFLIPLAFYLDSPFVHESSGSPVSLTDVLRHYYWGLVGERNLKITGFAGAFLTYDRLLDCFALFVIAVTIEICLLKRWGQVSFALAGAFSAMMVAYPFVPFVIMKTAWVDQRLPVMAAFLIFAGFLPQIPYQKAAALIAAIIFALFVTREVEIVRIWREHDVDVRDFRSLISVVSEGERVLVVRPEPDPDRNSQTNNADSLAEMLNNDATIHLPAFLVIDRKAFWPLLFTAVAKQPLMVAPPYVELAMPEGLPPQVHELSTPEAPPAEWAPYLHDWPKHFDWVIVLRPSVVANAQHLLPEHLDLIRLGRVAGLYKIRK